MAVALCLTIENETRQNIEVRTVLVLSIVLFPVLLLAQSRGVRVKVATEGAMVFKKPSFDSPVISYLRKGQKVLVTRRQRYGFRKIRVKKGVVGYIRVEDVMSPEQEQEHVSESEGRIQSEDTQESRRKPMLYTRFAGPLFGVISYQEEFIGQTVSSNLTSFGLKFSGPDLLVSGPFLMDINLAVHTGAPSYYQTLTGSPATGMLVLTDLKMVTPLSEAPDRIIYLLAGPVLTFTQFSVDFEGEALVLQQLHLGATIGAGAGFRVGSIALKLELNYHWEVNRYFSFLATTQFGF